MGPDHLLASPRTAWAWLRTRPWRTDPNWTPLDRENALMAAITTDDPAFTHDDPEGTTHEH